MIILNGRGLAMKRKVPLEAMSLQLKERDSTAGMTPADMEDISVGVWVQDEKEPGAGIVWRVRSINKAHNTQTSTVQLEHIISTLKDRLLFGEHTPVTITGNKNAKVCTARQAVLYILGKQSDWVLGEMLQEYQEVSQGYKFEGDSLFDALETVSNTLDGCFWTYDFSTYPFRLNLTRGMPEQSVGDEAWPVLRANRNIITASTSIDKSQMYTRIYPIGKDDLKLGGEGYLQDNDAVSRYGVIEHTETNASCSDAEELRAWAQERLEHHCFPIVSINVDGLELYRATGADIDRLQMGRPCTLAIAGEAMQARVVGLTYPDKLYNPERVQITMTNTREDVTKIVAYIAKKNQKSSRVAARQKNEDKMILYNTVKEVQIVQSGNDYKLQYKLVKDKDWQDAGTFNRAVASWTVSATGGTIKVTAHPQSQSKEVKVRGANGSWSGNVMSGNIQYYQDGTKTWAATGATYSVDATVRYNEGKKQATVSGSWTAEGVFKAVNVSNTARNVTAAIFDPTLGDITFDGTNLNVKLYSSINGSETRTFTNRTIPVPASKVRPTISMDWGNTGTLTVNTNPSASSARTVAIFDPTNSDVSFDGTNLNVTLYASMDGSETKTPTHRTIAVPASKVRPTISMNWGDNGALTVNTNPASSSPSTMAIFDPVSADISVSNNTINVHLYASMNGSETKTDTHRVIPVPSSVIHPLLSGNWASGTLTVNSNPAAASALTYGIFDTTPQDVTWTGNTGVIKVYVNQDGGETKIDTGKRLTVTANVVPTISGNWNSGTLTIMTNPAAASAKTYSIFDTTNADVTWSGAVGTVAVYVNQDGGETKIDTGKRLTINAPFTKYTFKKAYGVNDQPYRGAIYDSHGNQLSSENYYWYGYNYNFGTAVNTELWRHN